jgi:iron complex outermembrane receptor protein
MNVQYKNGILAIAVGSICSANVPTALAQVAGTRAGVVDEILVYGTQGARDSVTASRLGLTLQETPATIDVIDGDAIRARGDMSVLEAATRSAGFTNEANPGNGNSSIAARGFNGQGAVTKLYDGTHYYTAAGTTTFPFDSWGVERVEVLKGPSSVLFGEGGIGGAINVIPRKPERERGGDFRLLLGENDTAFVGIDLTGPLGDSVSYRIDYSNSQSDNWVFNGDSEVEMFSAAVRWDVSDDFALSARYDMGEQKPMRYFGVPVAQRDGFYGDFVDGTFSGDFIEEFAGSNFNVGDADLNFEDDSIRVEANWRATDTVSLQAQVFQLTSDRHWKNAETYFLEGTTVLERGDPLELGHDIDHTGLRTNVLFAPSGGGIRASVGFESNDVSLQRPTNFGGAHNPTGITFDETDIVNPRNFQPGTFAGIAGAAPYVLDNYADVSQWAVFGEAQFNPTDQVAIVASLRHDDYDTTYVRVARPPVFDQQVDSLTGRIGVVFDVSDETALYAQYGTGASHPAGTIVNVANTLREADMVESEQIELGLKHQIEGTGLQLNVALFDITMNNLTTDNPNSANPADVIVIPEQTSKGIEVGFTYTASSAFQVYGNAAVLDAETSTGEKPTFTPENTYNLGLAWGIADAVRVIADARYVGKRTTGYPTEIPAYTVVDASVRWNVSDDISLMVKADNIFDELYASAAYLEDLWMVGRPRTLSLAFDYRF